MVAALGRVMIGTSGFSYKEWKPSFYPKDVSQKKFLEYYASQFGAVEIDYTFYRMPTAKTLDSWKASTGEAFRFALKASRRITHFERLRVPSEALDYLLDTLPLLAERLGILLYQLPPNFKCDPERLELFLGACAVGRFSARRITRDGDRSVSVTGEWAFWTPRRRWVRHGCLNRPSFGLICGRYPCHQAA